MTSRICMVIERYHPFRGGSEVQCQLLSRSLAQHGIPVTIVTRRFDPSLPRFEPLDGIPVYRVAPAGFGRIWAEFGFAIFASLLLLRKRHEYDILHLHSGTSIAGSLFILLAKILGKKTVIKIATAGDIAKGRIETKGKIRHPSAGHRAVNAWINCVLRRADRIIAISQQIENELLANNFNAARIIRLPNAVDTQAYSPVDESERLKLRRMLNLPVDKLLVLFSGRLIHRKGVDILIRAWYRLSAFHNRSALIILGSGGRSLDSVEDVMHHQVARLGVGSSVLFAGEQTRVDRYLQAGDVFVFPSRREGLSNALLEAMSTGIPTVASAIGGTIDVIADGKTGLLFPPGDDRDLAKKLQRLLSDEQFRARLGRQARSAIAARYSVDTLLPRLLSLYHDLTRD